MSDAAAARGAHAPAGVGAARAALLAWVDEAGAEGRVTVNGLPLREPYLFPGNDPSATPFDVRVPEGRLWVMGDHRAASEDSRA
ncbi:MAG TPA: S26 family signal peptidase, partial [Longimicrobiaceae bacterium]|nr:S26 family signal peptidase [Longimicrobiaceae bacterium]